MTKNEKEVPEPKHRGGIMYVPKMGQPVEIYPTPKTLFMCYAVIKQAEIARAFGVESPKESE